MVGIGVGAGIAVVGKVGIAVGSPWAGKIVGGNYPVVDWFEGPQKDYRSVVRS